MANENPPQVSPTTQEGTTSPVSSSFMGQAAAGAEALSQPQAPPPFVRPPMENVPMADFITDGQQPAAAEPGQTSKPFKRPPMTWHPSQNTPVPTLPPKDETSYPPGDPKGFLHSMPRNSKVSEAAIDGLRDRFASPLAGFMKDIQGLGFNAELTGGYARAGHRNSSHYTGDAADFWIYRQGPNGERIDVHQETNGSISQQIHNIAQGYGLRYHDEYKGDPKKGWAFPHMHVELDPAMQTEQMPAVPGWNTTKHFENPIKARPGEPVEGQPPSPQSNMALAKIAEGMSGHQYWSNACAYAVSDALKAGGMDPKELAKMTKGNPNWVPNYANVGMKITNPKQLQQGDLVIYNTGQTYDHIGIYAGNGEAWNVSTSRGYKWAKTPIGNAFQEGRRLGVPDQPNHGSAEIDPPRGYGRKVRAQARDLEDTTKAFANQYHIDDPNMLVKQFRVESGYNKDAVSEAGARGIPQCMEGTATPYLFKMGKTWKDYLHDENLQMRVGAQHMSSLLKQYGNWPQALAAYNAGPGGLGKIQAGKDIPETTDYVSKVLGIPHDKALEAIRSGNYKPYDPAKAVEAQKNQDMSKQTVSQQVASLNKVFRPNAGGDPLGGAGEASGSSGPSSGVGQMSTLNSGANTPVQNTWGGIAGQMMRNLNPFDTKNPDIQFAHDVWMNAANKTFFGIPGIFGMRPSAKFHEFSNSLGNVEGFFASSNPKVTLADMASTTLLAELAVPYAAAKFGITGATKLFGGMGGAEWLGTRLGNVVKKAGNVGGIGDWLSHMGTNASLGSAFKWMAAMGATEFTKAMDESMAEGKSMSESVPTALAAGSWGIGSALVLGTLVPGILGTGAICTSAAARGAFNLGKETFDKALYGEFLGKYGQNFAEWTSNQWGHLPQGMRDFVTSKFQGFYEKMDFLGKAMISDATMGYYNGLKKMEVERKILQDLTTSRNVLGAEMEGTKAFAEANLQTIKNAEAGLQANQQKLQAAQKVVTDYKNGLDPTGKPVNIAAEITSYENIAQQKATHQAAEAAARNIVEDPALQNAAKAGDKNAINLIKSEEAKLTAARQGIAKADADIANLMKGGNPHLVNYIGHVQQKIPMFQQELARLQASPGIAQKAMLQSQAAMAMDIVEHHQTLTDDLLNQLKAKGDKNAQAMGVGTVKADLVPLLSGYSMTAADKEALKLYKDVLGIKLKDGLSGEVIPMAQKEVQDYIAMTRSMPVGTSEANFELMKGIRSALHADIQKSTNVAEKAMLAKQFETIHRVMEKFDPTKKASLTGVTPKDIEAKILNPAQTLTQNLKDYALGLDSKGNKVFPEGDLLNLAKNKNNPIGTWLNPSELNATTEAFYDAAINMISGRYTPSAMKFQQILEMAGKTDPNEMSMLFSSTMRDNQRVQDAWYQICRQYGQKNHLDAIFGAAERWGNSHGAMEKFNDTVAGMIQEEFNTLFKESGLAKKLTQAEKLDIIKGIEGSREDLAKVLTAHPELKKPLGMYFSTLATMERYMVHSQGLKSAVLDGYFYHIYPRFNEFLRQSGTSADVSRNLSSLLRTERHRSYATLEASMKAATDAEQAVEQATGMKWKEWMLLRTHEERLNALARGGAAPPGSTPAKPLSWHNSHVTDLYDKILLGDANTDIGHALGASIRAKLKAENTRVMFDLLTRVPAEDGLPVLRKAPSRVVPAQSPIEGAKGFKFVDAATEDLARGGVRKGSGYSAPETQHYKLLSSIPGLERISIQGKPASAWQIHPQAAKYLDDYLLNNNMNSLAKHPFWQWLRSVDLIQAPVAHLASIMSNVMHQTGWNMGEAVGLFGLGQHIAETDRGLLLRAFKSGLNPASYLQNLKIPFQDLKNISDPEVRKILNTLYELGPNGGGPVSSLFEAAQTGVEKGIGALRNSPRAVKAINEALLFEAISNAQIGAWVHQVSKVWGNKELQAELIGKFGSYEAALTDVQRWAADLVNKRAGTLPTYMMSSTAKQVFYTTALAPQYLASKVDTLVGALDGIFGRAAKYLNKGAGIRSRFTSEINPQMLEMARNQARNFLVGALIADFTYTQAFSYMINGHSTFANPQEDKRMHISLGDGPEGRMYVNSPLFGMFRQLKRAAEGMYGGNIQPTMTAATNVLHPFFGVIAEIATGHDDNGRLIAPQKSLSKEGMLNWANYLYYRMSSAHQLASPLLGRGFEGNSPYPGAKISAKEWALGILGMSPSRPNPVENEIGGYMERRLEFYKQRLNDQVDNLLNTWVREQDNKYLDQAIDLAMHKGIQMGDAELRQIYKQHHSQGHYVMLDSNQLWKKIDDRMNPRGAAKGKVPVEMQELYFKKIQEAETARYHDYVGKLIPPDRRKDLNKLLGRGRADDSEPTFGDRPYFTPTEMTGTAPIGNMFANSHKVMPNRALGYDANAANLVVTPRAARAGQYASGIYPTQGMTPIPVQSKVRMARKQSTGTTPMYVQPYKVDTFEDSE